MSNAARLAFKAAASAPGEDTADEVGGTVGELGDGFTGGGGACGITMTGAVDGGVPPVDPVLDPFVLPAGELFVFVVGTLDELVLPVGALVLPAVEVLGPIVLPVVEFELLVVGVVEFVLPAGGLLLGVGEAG